jgi:serine/threonine protein kinase
MDERSNIEDGIQKGAQGFAGVLETEIQGGCCICGWFEDYDSVYLAMEYVPLGDLEINVPAQSGVVKEAEIMEITTQILEGLKIMRWEAFVHRDLKPKVYLLVLNTPSTKSRR